MMSARTELVMVFWLTIVLLNWNNIVECKAIGEAYKNSGVVCMKFCNSRCNLVDRMFEAFN
jgi:hypothetical protein